MKQITLYIKDPCPLCDEAEDALKTLQDTWDLRIEKVDIYRDETLLELYQLRIPVVKMGDRIVAEGIVTVDDLKKAFEESGDC